MAGFRSRSRSSAFTASRYPASTMLMLLPEISEAGRAAASRKTASADSCNLSTPEPSSICATLQDTLLQ
jgi:hypothetical protein